MLLNDLVRDRVPYLFFRLANPLLARSPLTRHDGRVSLLRAYTGTEMRAILDKAGCRKARIHLVWIYYRMTIVAGPIVAEPIVAEPIVAGKASK